MNMKTLLQLISPDIPLSANEIVLLLGRPIIYKLSNKPVIIDKTVTEELLNDILKMVTDNSVYAVGEYAKEGYLTYRGGVRIGLAGDYLLDGNGLKVIKHIRGLVIRIPHEIIGCSSVLTDRYLNRSILIVSRPYAGKTTFLRDLSRRISYIRQTVVIDERHEISGSGVLDIGNSLVLSGISKYALYEGIIRSLSPETVVTDELFGENEYSVSERIYSSGISVVSSIHGSDLDHLPKECDMFDIKVLLSRYPSLGTIQEVRYG